MVFFLGNQLLLIPAVGLLLLAFGLIYAAAKSRIVRANAVLRALAPLLAIVSFGFGILLFLLGAEELSYFFGLR